jgi:uncharacterized protein (TIGR02300 family)
VVIDKSLGTKRQCPECHKKFYDLGKSPAVCPYCEHSFVPKPILPSKQDQMEASQAAAETPVPEAPLPEPEVAADEVDVVDAAAEDVADVPDVALEDVEDVPADPADDAVFLEDEGDTPVEDIIPAKVEKDDEDG